MLPLTGMVTTAHMVTIRLPGTGETKNVFLKTAGCGGVVTSVDLIVYLREHSDIVYDPKWSWNDLQYQCYMLQCTTRVPVELMKNFGV